MQGNQLNRALGMACLALCGVRGALSAGSQQSSSVGEFHNLDAVGKTAASGLPCIAH